MFEMEVFIDVEGRAFEDVHSEVGGVRFGAEFEGVVANEFVIDLHFDDLLFLVHAKYIKLWCCLNYKSHIESKFHTFFLLPSSIITLILK